MVMPSGKHVEDECNSEILAHGQKIFNYLTAAVVDDRAVLAPTLELEQLK